MDPFFIVFFIFILAFSLVINKILLKLAENVGVRNQENTVRWSSDQKPALGGIGFYTIFLFSFIICLIFYNNSLLLNNQKLLALLASTTLAFLMGLADDAYNTRPYLKFLTQVLCGAILAWSGIYIHLFDHPISNYFLTIFWIVGIMNAINLLDNMDGISSITASFIILAILSVMMQKDHIHSPQFVITLGVLASLIGFLVFNWSPSKMFMGDTGSQFLGLYLGAIGIQYLWNYEPLTESITPWKSVFLVLIVFALPIIDTTVVFTNRIRRGQSPFVGGKDHTSHNLSYLGLSDHQVGLAYVVISIISLALVIYSLFIVDNWTRWHGMIYGLYFTLLLIGFFYLTRYNRTKLHERT